MTKQQASSSLFARYIQELYAMEHEEHYHEVMQRTVTFNFPAEDACMLAAIAKRFGKSTAAFGGDLFAEHVRQLFLALSPQDRRNLAVEADNELTRYANSKGITITTGDQPGSQQWQMYANMCDEVDAKGSL